MTPWRLLFPCRSSIPALLRNSYFCSHANKCLVSTGNFLPAKRPLFYTPRKYLTNGSINENSSKESEVLKDAKSEQPIGNISLRLAISFTCKVCGHRSENKTMSKKAYTEGVVIITCDGCGNNHLIADNLEWFSDKGKKINVEQLMAQKGENVKRGIFVDQHGNGDCKEVEII